jgi:hypothetical protein
MRRFRSVAELEQHLQSIVGVPEYNQERLDQTLRDESQRRRELAEEINDELARVAVLTGRITSFRRNAPDSRRFEWEQMVFRWKASNVLSHPLLGKSENEDPETWHEIWDQYDKAHEAFSDKLIALERAMKPPRRRLYRRTIAWAGRFLQRTRNLGSALVGRLRGGRDEATGS